MSNSGFSQDLAVVPKESHHLKNTSNEAHSYVKLRFFAIVFVAVVLVCFCCGLSVSLVLSLLKRC